MFLPLSRTKRTHGTNYFDDYFTDAVANFTLDFIANATQKKTPFFAMLGTPACHGPNDPAPQYATTYAEMEAPRLPTWNKAPQPEKHYLLRNIAPMQGGEIDTSDVFFERRWSVLRSVDDAIVRLVDAVTAAGEIDNTYWVFTGDHGYHLGEFGMLYDKRMLYETDIRVPLFASGPGIAAGLVVPGPVSHADLAPTILAMAGIDARVEATQMDGRSWLSLVAENAPSPPAVWRTEFVIEYGASPPFRIASPLDRSESVGHSSTAHHTPLSLSPPRTHTHTNRRPAGRWGREHAGRGGRCDYSPPSRARCCTLEREQQPTEAEGELHGGQETGDHGVQVQLPLYGA